MTKINKQIFKFHLKIHECCGLIFSLYLQLCLNSYWQNSIMKIMLHPVFQKIKNALIKMKLVQLFKSSMPSVYVCQTNLFNSCICNYCNI